MSLTFNTGTVLDVNVFRDAQRLPRLLARAQTFNTALIIPDTFFRESFRREKGWVDDIHRSFQLLARKPQTRNILVTNSLAELASKELASGIVEDDFINWDATRGLQQLLQGPFSESEIRLFFESGTTISLHGLEDDVKALRNSHEQGHNDFLSDERSDLLKKRISELASKNKKGEEFRDVLESFAAESMVSHLRDPTDETERVFHGEMLQSLVARSLVGRFLLSRYLLLSRDMADGKLQVEEEWAANNFYDDMNIAVSTLALDFATKDNDALQRYKAVKRSLRKAIEMVRER